VWTDLSSRLRKGGCDRPDNDLRPPETHVILDCWRPDGLNNLVLLCRRHHHLRLILYPPAGWHIRLGTDQQPDFIPPPTSTPADTTIVRTQQHALGAAREG
jgi:hypothetical protein